MITIEEVEETIRDKMFKYPETREEVEFNRVCLSILNDLTNLFEGDTNDI